MDTLTVDLGERSYNIHIDSGLLDNLLPLMPVLSGRQVMIVTNTTVVPLYLEKVTQTISAIGGISVDTVILPDGEKYKDLNTLNAIFSALLEKDLGHWAINSKNLANRIYRAAPV